MGTKFSAVSSATMEGIDQAQIDQLPPELKSQLEAYLENQSKYIEELKENHEQFKVNSEQKYFEVEKELISSKETLTVESKAASDLRKQLIDLEQKYNDSSQKLRDLQQTQFEREREWNELQQNKSQLQLEKSDLAAALERKNIEIDRLSDEWKEMSRKVNEANKEKLEALAKLNEIQSEGASLQHRENQLQQEKEQMQHRISWFERELKEKTTELMNIRKEKSLQLIELQSQLDEKSDEVNRLTDNVNSLKESGESQTERIETYIQKLQDMRESHTQMEEQFRNEIQAQEKLIDLYKSSSSESETKVSDLVKAVSELQRLLQEAGTAHAEVEKQREEDLATFKVELSTKDEAVNRLKQELDHANELLDTMKKKGVVPITDESVEMLSPSAAAASRLLKSGMTLTQIYSEYVQVSETLVVEQEENKRLNTYLDQILKEIQEKAPIMKKQREEYEKSVHTISQLTSQLDTAMLECERLRITGDENSRTVGQQTREINLMKQQIVDLGQQVKMLLKELEQARGTVVSTTYMPETEQSEVSSSSQVISQRLVTFRSIEELQEQNQKLLAVVRELSEHQEMADKESDKEQSQELKKQMERMTEELEDMRNSRQKQMEMVESLVRQRDMYKSLATQGGDAQPMTPMTPASASTPMPRHAQPQQSPHGLMGSPAGDYSKKLDETTETLKELQEDFNVYRREKQANERMISEQADRYKQEASDLRVQNARIASQLDFSGERFKVLQSNVDGYKKEINQLRDRNQKMSLSLVKHEQTISSLREECMSTQTKLAHAEVQVQNLMIEKGMLKNIESRLHEEKENIMREQRSREIMMANLQAIQNNLERAEFETKTRLTQQIDSLERDNTVLRRQLDGAEGQNRTFISTIERQLKDAQANLQEEISKHGVTRNKLLECEKHIVELKNELSQAEAQYAAAEIKLANAGHTGTASRSGAVASDDVKHLRTQLEQSSMRIISLQEEANIAKQHANQYKSMADSLEQNLKDVNKASEEFKTSTEKRIEELQNANTFLQQHVASIEPEIQRLKEENIKLNSESHESSAELRRQLTHVQHELAESIKLREQAIENEQSAKQDLSAQAQLAQDCQDKYERELVLHAADVKSLTQIKEELDAFNARLAASQEETAELKQILEVSKASWAEQERILKEDNTKQQERIDSAQKQHKLLLEEMENMSEKMKKIQQAHDRESGHSEAIKEIAQKDEEIGRSSEQLLEVIKFLRKDKDIAESMVEVHKAENSRLKQQLEYAKKEYAEANNTLAEERQTTQANVQTAAQHAELLRKVEQLNLLQDSNRLMREEKDGILQQLREAQNKAESVSAQIEPLQKKGHDLQAQIDALSVEKSQLQEEIARWKARCNHLVEQCNKADPEEFQRMIVEIGELKKNISELTNDRNKLRVENGKANEALKKSRIEITQKNQTIEKLNALKSTLEAKENEIASLKTQVENKQKEINALRTNIGQKDKEIGNLKKTIEQKDTEVKNAKAETEKITKEKDANSKTLLQLKRIGNKYKQQALDADKAKDEAIKQKDEALAKLKEGQGKATEAEMKQLQEKLAKSEAELATMTEKCASAETEKNQTLREKREVESKATEATEKVKAGEEEIKSLKETIIKKDKEIVSNNRFKVILEKAKVSLEKQKQDIAKLTKENNELKAKAAAPGSAPTTGTGETPQEDKSQTEELNKLRKENMELQKKISQLQKQLESQQKPSPSVSATRPTVSASPVERTATGTPEAPRTANIRPMSTPTGTSRVQSAPTPTRVHVQSAPVQPVRGTTAETSRATASIRPITVAPTAMAPTAMVMPSTQSVQDNVPVSQPSPAQVRPTQQVQPVTSQVDPQITTSSEATISASESAEIEPSPAQMIQAMGGASTEVQTLPAPSTSTSASSTGAAEAVDVSPLPSTSSKRTHTEMEEDQDSAQVESAPTKRTRLVQEPAVQEEAPEIELHAPEIFIEPFEATVIEPAAEAEAVTETSQAPSDAQAPEEQVQAEPEMQEEQVDTGADDTQETIETGEMQAEETEQMAEAGPEDVEAGEEEEEEELQADETEVSQEQDEEEEDEEEGIQEDDTQPEEDEEDDDVICVDSGEEEGEASEDQEFDDEEEEEEEDEEDIDVDPDDENEGMDEDVDDEEDEEEGGEIMQQGDEIVVLDDEDEEGQEESEAAMEASEAPPQQPAVPAPQPVTIQTRQVPALARVPSQPGIGRAGLGLMISGEGGFDGDEGIVPSTPTLFIPRRTDGFAEAVPSPQVQQSFQFGAGVEGLSQDGQLASQALGMDDTRMDLSQFDDAAGPSPGQSSSATSQTRVTPSISITEPSPPPEDPQDQTAPEVPQEALESTSPGEVPELSTDQPDVEEADGGNSQEGNVEEGDSEDAKPSTSGGKSDDGAKPKKVIQKIVWSEPAGGAAVSPPTQPAPQASLQNIPVQATRGTRGQTRRGQFARRAATGQFRGRGVGQHPGQAPGQPQQGHAGMQQQPTRGVVQGQRSRGGNRARRSFRGGKHRQL